MCYILQIWQILQIVGDAYSQAVSHISHIFLRKKWFINHGESAHQSKPPSTISHGFNRAQGSKSCLPVNASECNRDYKCALRQSAPATECMTLTLSWNEGEKKGLMIFAVQGKDFHAKSFGGRSVVMGTLVIFLVQAKPTKYLWWHNQFKTWLGGNFERCCEGSAEYVFLAYMHM